MKFVRWTLTPIARRFSHTGLGLPISSPASKPLDGLPLRESAETVAGAQENAAIHSRYASNVHLSPIVCKFAGLLHEQLDLAGTAQASGDMEALARFGHWLAGTAGTVGYDAFTLPARELQALAKQGDAQAVATALGRLTRMASQLVVPDSLETS